VDLTARPSEQENADMLMRHTSGGIDGGLGYEAGALALNEREKRRGIAVHECVAAAAVLLAQAKGFIASVDAEAYACPCGAASGGTIGGHVRHCLDHFSAAMRVIEHALEPIDYDHRERDVPMERHPFAAMEAIDSLTSALSIVPRSAIDAPVAVRIMVDADGRTVDLTSTFGRELAFATHHALHHHAMMKFIADALGLGTPAGFGKAPSTINHEQNRSARLAS
jgi:hypothetical protein